MRLGFFGFGIFGVEGFRVWGLGGIVPWKTPKRALTDPWKNSYRTLVAPFSTLSLNPTWLQGEDEEKFACLNQHARPGQDS